MTCTIPQLVMAMETFSAQREALVSLDDPRARHHEDLLTHAIRECQGLIRDRQLASQVHQHQEHAKTTGLGTLGDRVRVRGWA